MKSIKPIKGLDLAALMLSSLDPFIQSLEKLGLSKDYLSSARCIVRGFARFCSTEPAVNPWQIREHYLQQRGVLRAQQPFSVSFLQSRGKELSQFLRWVKQRAERNQDAVEWTIELAHTYESTRQDALQYQKRILRHHLPYLIPFAKKFTPKGGPFEIDVVLKAYFEQRRLAMRGAGWGMVMTHRMRIVTRRHLIWLERQGHLPECTARAWGETVRATDMGADDVMAIFEHRVNEASLPPGLRQGLLDYLKHLVDERRLVKSSIDNILRTNLSLCRRLDHEGIESFGKLSITLLDETVSSLLISRCEDLLKQRRRVQALHSQLRGFLRWLYVKHLMARDLSPLLFSPPCYRASTPPKALSTEQLQRLLDSFDHGCAKGRRGYAIVMLMATVGLRPVDVSGLKLDDIHWRNECIAITQSKTGTALTLPLLDEVARAIYAYLRHDRDLLVPCRQVFLSLNMPHRPLRPAAVSRLVSEAMRDVGLHQASAYHLRHGLAVQLQRQGQALSTIQEILGHRIADTTQRYAVTDPVILRQILDEDER